MRRKLKMMTRYKGLTLTEVIMASALLLVVMVPILKALTGVHVSSVEVERKTRSLTLAQGKLDDIRARSVYNYSSSFAESHTSLDGPYLCVVTDGGAASDLRQITVAVGYDIDSDGTLQAQEIDVTLASLIARRW